MANRPNVNTQHYRYELDPLILIAMTIQLNYSEPNTLKTNTIVNYEKAKNKYNESEYVFVYVNV